MTALARSGHDTCCEELRNPAAKKARFVGKCADDNDPPISAPVHLQHVLLCPRILKPTHTTHHQISLGGIALRPE
jgi:hypothetical protein